MKLHKSLTVKRVVEAAEEEMFGPAITNPGFCLACGEEQEGCEPDAEKYECENCEKREVYGAATVAMMLI